MRALAITKSYNVGEEGSQVVNTESYECNFDQTELFSWTVIKDEQGVPDYIVIITKSGVSLELEYSENVLSNLASEFRSRNVL